MNGQAKYIDPAEFRELGLLQEINRLILHPAGLAMEMTINADGTMAFSGCWDYRDDPEGIYFGPGMIDPAKVAKVNQLIAQHADQRTAFLGVIVQEHDTPVAPIEEDQP